MDKGDTTWYGRTLEDDNLKRCWNECRHDSHIDQRSKEIELFNKLISLSTFNDVMILIVN